ncbi:MAG: hypothetical protein HDQ98_01175 [Lachnospiraceae bacterium]|nr:hypothetical protein [Lachnospiraceae bacterium]
MTGNRESKKHKKIHFRIVRKWAFAGALLPYKLYINGEYAGLLTNGKTLDLDVSKSDIYFIDELFAPYDGNAIICASDMENSDLISVEIRRAGGWKTNSYKEFFVYKNGEYVTLPSFDYTHYVHVGHNDTIRSGLTEQEKRFARCLEFREAVSDAADVLCSEILFDMLDAIKCIGAKQYTIAFDTILEQLFAGIALPLDDNMRNNKDIAAKIEKANHIVRDCVKLNGAMEELHKCLVTYIIEHLTDSHS